MDNKTTQLKMNVRGITQENVAEAIQFASDRLADIERRICLSMAEPAELFEERDLLFFRLSRMNEFQKYGAWQGTVDAHGQLTLSN